ncbi:MAG: translation initiation factor IF-2 [Brevinematia bacterium]
MSDDKKKIKIKIKKKTSSKQGDEDLLVKEEPKVQTVVSESKIESLEREEVSSDSRPTTQDISKVSEEKKVYNRNLTREGGEKRYYRKDYHRYDKRRESGTWGGQNKREGRRFDKRDNQSKEGEKKGFQKSFGKFSLQEKFGQKSQQQRQQRPSQIRSPKLSTSTLKKVPSKFIKKEDREVEFDEESLESKLDAEFVKKQKKEVFAVPDVIEIYDVITVGELAKKMNVKASVVIDILQKLGLTVTINDKIDVDTATLVAEEFGCRVIVKSIFDEITVQEEPDDPNYVKERVPVVTVMGHVDHGKTTLLDAIRNTRVAQSETGGITQHIGASVVEINGKKITFIDTPGHEAFTAMRAKGAKVTDIVVLVVAADDGVKEQTLEALNHAKDAKVPIIVAVNKIDAPGANPDRVKNQLSDLGLIPDEWGGDTMYVQVSALKKLNIDKLLEAILLQAEVMELKADYHKKGMGFVIESKIEQGRGVVFTIIVKNGIVRVGDYFVVGSTKGKVRAIFDDKGNKVNEILPGLPGEIVGADELPLAGDKFNVVDSEDVANEISEKRKYYSKIENIKTLKRDVDLFDGVKELKYIVKGDVFGSVEAIKYALEKLSNEEVKVRVIHYGVGQVSESDIMLASAGKASIIAFRTKVGAKAAEIAETEKVKIKKYNIIYDIVEDVKKEIRGMKEPTLVEKVLGTAEIRKVFRISEVGNVAGCYVKSGVIQRKAKVRIYRDNKLIFDGEILSLKHLKDDVSEVKEGFECGIAFKNFSDIKEGDFIECYVIEEQR